MVLSSLRSSGTWSIAWSAITPIGSRKSEWMVCPPTLRAATPVGAAITTCFEVFHDKWFRSVDLPVPARPVTKMFSRVFSMSSKTAACSAESANSATALLPPGIRTALQSTAAGANRPACSGRL